jgi:hypothetical protein
MQTRILPDIGTTPEQRPCPTAQVLPRERRWQRAANKAPGRAEWIHARHYHRRIRESAVTCLEVSQSGRGLVAEQRALDYAVETPAVVG